jgi:HAD superfamily hydrolase (TIGR01549 family)
MIVKNKSLSLNHFCFDLDGTLIDSNKTIYETTAHTLKHLGIEFNVSEDDFANHIGRHFVDIFNHFNLQVPDFDLFISKYKQKYFDLMEYSKMYPGVTETLEELKFRGNKISLLTTKVQDQADRIIDHFNLRQYFDLVMGRRDGIPHKPSPIPLQLLCEELNIDVVNTLMIGDTELDILCGISAGAKTCGVLYGYRTEEQLKKESPDFIVRSVKEILFI